MSDLKALADARNVLDALYWKGAREPTGDDFELLTDAIKAAAEAIDRLGAMQQEWSEMVGHKDDWKARALAAESALSAATSREAVLREADRLSRAALEAGGEDNG